MQNPKAALPGRCTSSRERTMSSVVRQPSGEASSAAGCRELQLPAVLDPNRSSVSHPALTTYATNRNLLLLRGASMKNSLHRLMIVTIVVALTLVFAPLSIGQQTNSIVPTLVNFSGTLTDANSKPLRVPSASRFICTKISKAERRCGSRLKMSSPTRTGITPSRWVRRRARDCRLTCLPLGKPAGWACRHKDRPSSRGSCCWQCPMP